MKKRVLVTGGLGYLGARIVKLLSSNNFIVRLATSKELNLTIARDDFEIVTISWEDLISLENAIKDVDYIVHTAGANSKDCEADPTLALRINAISTSNLLKVVNGSNSIKKIIYFSTAHVYNSPLTGKLNELTHPKNLHPYATSHRAAEEVLLYGELQNNIPTIIFRLSNAFGAPIYENNNCWDLFVNDICAQIVLNNKIEIKSKINQYRDFISISKVASSVLFMLENYCDSGIYNLGSGITYSLTEMASIIQERAFILFKRRFDVIMPANFVQNPDIQKFSFDIKKIEAHINDIRGVDMDEIDNLLIYCKEIRFKK